MSEKLGSSQDGAKRELTATELQTLEEIRSGVWDKLILNALRYPGVKTLAFPGTGFALKLTEESRSELDKEK